MQVYGRLLAYLGLLHDDDDIEISTILHDYKYNLEKAGYCYLERCFFFTADFLEH